MRATRTSGGRSSRFRLWMPVALQLLLIVAVAWYTSTRFPGFINRANVNSILFLAVPLAVVAMAQTHALLVGYLDLSVGAMVTLGVVVASFLIGPESTTYRGRCSGSARSSGAGWPSALVNAGLVRGLKIPSIIATLATLSILNGISLTLRETPGGIIDRDFTSWLGTEHRADPDRVHRDRWSGPSRSTTGSTPAARDSSCARPGSTSDRRNAAASARRGSGPGR